MIIEKKYTNRDKFDAFYKDKKNDNIIKYIFIRKISSFIIGKLYKDQPYN